MSTPVHAGPVRRARAILPLILLAAVALTSPPASALPPDHITYSVEGVVLRYNPAGLLILRLQFDDMQGVSSQGPNLLLWSLAGPDPDPPQPFLDEDGDRLYQGVMGTVAASIGATGGPEGGQLLLKLESRLWFQEAIYGFPRAAYGARYMFVERNYSVYQGTQLQYYGFVHALGQR